MRPGAMNLGTKAWELSQLKADFLSEFPCFRTGIDLGSCRRPLALSALGDIAPDRKPFYGFTLPLLTDQTYDATANACSGEIPPGYATIRVDGTPCVAT
jgi:hypothetical protein